MNPQGRETMRDLMEAEALARPRYASLCVVTAAEIEFRAVAGILQRAETSVQGGLRMCRGNYLNNRITVLLSEIGAVGFAERLDGHLRDNDYDGLLVLGLAGGLDARLRAGDAVVYDACLRLSGTDADRDAAQFVREKRGAREEIASISCDAALSAAVCESLDTGLIRHQRVVGATVARILVDAAEKADLAARSGAAVVDMETFQVLSVCARIGLPVAVARVISDERAHTLPDFNRALDRQGRISGMKALLAMLASPFAALSFVANLRRAMAALNRVAGVALRL